MAYEIPQQLQHKERIIFGLTFGQLGWTALWGSLTLVVLVQPLPATPKFVLAAFPAVLGVLFVYFDLYTWIRRSLRYLAMRRADLGSKRMTELLPITAIKDDTIHAEKPVALIKVQPLNYKIKPKEEQEAIITGFQKFLNSLDFPVQIIITTRPLSITPYLDHLKQRTKEQALIEDFAAFTQERLREQMNREFYLAIPETDNLDIQTKVCIDQLQGIGLQARRLTDNELLRYFNPHPGRDAPQGVAGLHYLLAPTIITDKIDHLAIDEELTRIITATGYPRSVESGFLDKLISSNDHYDISIHIEPYSIESMMVLLNRELMKQRADLHTEQTKHSINPSLEIKYRDTLKVLEALQKGEEKLFNVTLLISCKAKTKEALDLLTNKVVSELHGLMIIPRTPYFQQLTAYQSTLPLANDAIKTKRNVTTKALSTFFPFTSPFLTMELDGCLLGLNKNNVPYIKDLFSLSNANGVVLATSGAGKSYFTKLLISRQRLTGASITVIDPQGEYAGLTQACNGELITISRKSKTIINPLDLMGHDFIEKRLALMDLFKIMFGDLTEVQRSILDRAINETYAKKGITQESYKGKKPPILSDLYHTLEAMDNDAPQAERITYRALLNRLYLYTDGVFGFLNRQSSINYGKDFVTFNIGNMPKQVKPVVMFLILDYAYMTMKRRPGRKLFIVDEAWSLLGRAEDASYLFEIVKTCRKFNMGLLLITQDVADLLASKAGHAVLANSSYSFLLRQKPAVIDHVAKTFHLSQAEKEYLLTATQGKGILILDNEHQELSVIASQKEHELITTNPNEQSRKAPTDSRADVTIQLSTDQGLYYGKDLTIEDKNYLANHGYRPGSFVPIGKPRQEEVWVKKNKVESLEHTFLVHNIKEHVTKYTQEVAVNVVSDADLSFNDAKGRSIGIEVETGNQYRKGRKALPKKFHELKAAHHEVYIILTDKNYKRQYEHLLPDHQILLRKNVPALLQNLYPRTPPARSRGCRTRQKARNRKDRG